MKLADALEKEFTRPVVVVNDVDAGVYAENRFGARGRRVCVGVFPGTGIGGGLVYDGKIVRGRTSSCMEIGHIPVVAERFALRLGLDRLSRDGRKSAGDFVRWALAAYRGQAPSYWRDAGTDISNIRGSVLAGSSRGGDKAVERIFQRAAGHIGYAVATVVNLLLPDVVVLGGGMVEAMPEVVCRFGGRESGTAPRASRIRTAVRSEDGGVGRQRQRDGGSGLGSARD